MSDRYGGAYIDGLSPVVMGPVGGELQQQLSVTGDLAQAEQTMAATGTVTVVSAPAVVVVYGGGFQYVSAREEKRQEVAVTRADLRQARQRMVARGIVRAAVREIILDAEIRSRLPRVAGGLCLGVVCAGQIESRRPRMRARAVHDIGARDRRDVQELLMLVDVLDGETRSRVDVEDAA